ncbi:MAG: hypothetical protein FJX95_01625 [Bacteroidetes bacterium]|nr:hypothetical protein [Bacteroidota bacterium]
MKFYLAVLGFLLGLSSVSQVMSPDIDCSQVDLTGSTTIQWTAPQDPNNEFVSYHIFASVGGGTFVEIGQETNLANAFFVDGVNNANNDQICYYIVVEYSSPAGNIMADPGLTFCNTFLTALSSTNPQGYVNLDWTGTAVGNYTMAWDNGTNSWGNILTIPFYANDTSLEVITCGDPLSFVLYANQGVCANVSNIATGIFFDQTPPAIPLVTSVSVTQGHPQVFWNPSTSVDTEGYILYRCSGGGLTVLDTVASNIQSYTDMTVNSATQTGCYLLSAFDGCLTGNPSSPNTSPTGNTCNCSILLTPLVQTPCTDKITLTWTPYSGWENGIAFYVLYHAEAAGNFVAVDTVPSNYISWIHNLNNYVSLDHSFYVMAVSNEGQFAISNVQSITLNYPTPPAMNYLSSVSVTEDNEIQITVQTSLTADPHFYYLQYFNDFFEEWMNVDVPSKENNVVPVVFNISNMNPKYFSYQFRVAIINECSDTTAITNIGKNILLEALVYDDSDINAIQWTPYQVWTNGIEKYNVYRKLGKNGSFTKILEFNPSQLGHYDNVDSLYMGDGLFFYRIEAVAFPTENFPDTAFTAFSNTVEMLQTPKIFIPNAMMIGGVNNVFKPIISFAPQDFFEMYVYSKWGDVLYEGHDYNEGWDGTDLKGEPVPQGAYVYYIRYRKGTDAPIEDRGQVIVLYGQ